jgi:hypothetical protein
MGTGVCEKPSASGCEMLLSSAPGCDDESEKSFPTDRPRLRWIYVALGPKARGDHSIE